MKDLSNQVFGHLMAIKPTKQRKWGSVVWQYKCLYCGNEQVYKDAGNLQKPHDHNCGCHNLTIQDLIPSSSKFLKEGD